MRKSTARPSRCSEFRAAPASALFVLPVRYPLRKPIREFAPARRAACDIAASAQNSRASICAARSSRKSRMNLFSASTARRSYRLPSWNRTETASPLAWFRISRTGSMSLNSESSLLPGRPGPGLPGGSSSAARAGLQNAGANAASDAAPASSLRRPSLLECDGPRLAGS